ncbi:DNA polymerase delta, subunit 4-domain-containing protein [Elsinoe ampelina]|uniref:DNA polymerase delta, subunit 4-domain-containing protein n=1 Tax=Elsinoe ampelina TaxID=302913 RepID=A0A6A6GQR6_9PEZI|nr:DNA polymerase delta, subunit 4-domain-containing protein [Elsinoe ampelina]
MPPKRTTRTSSRGTRTSGQGVLSFNARVTKPNTSPRSAKSKKDPGLLEAELHDQSAPDSAVSPPAKSLGPPPAADPISTSPVKTEDVLGGLATPEPETPETNEEEAADNAAALKLPVSRIKSYWREKEAARLAPRVHQEGLSLAEKILREWDMSGQYGPCIGISRVGRWRRAKGLGLEPPLEVLGVLLGRLDGEGGGKGKGAKGGGNGKGVKEEEEGVEGRAYVDLLMGNRMVAV